MKPSSSDQSPALLTTIPTWSEFQCCVPSCIFKKLLGTLICSSNASGWIDTLMHRPLNSALNIYHEISASISACCWEKHPANLDVRSRNKTFFQGENPSLVYSMVVPYSQGYGIPQNERLLALESPPHWNCTMVLYQRTGKKNCLVFSVF